MPKKKYDTILIVILLLTMTRAMGQEVSYRFFDIYDGLVQSQVMVLTQDSRGYLWIGTKGGVSRFNGEHFVNFTTKEGLIPGAIHSIAEDHAGYIWFASRNGISSWDGRNLSTFKYDFKNPPHIAVDEEGRLWLSTGKASPFIFKDSVFIQQRDLPDTIFTQPSFSKKQNRLLWAGPKQIVATEGDSIVHLLPRDYPVVKMYNYGIGLFAFATTENGIIELFRESPSGFEKVAAWKGTEVLENTLDEVLYFSMRPKFYKLEPGARQLVTFPEINRFAIPEFELVDKHGHMWIATEEGLIQFFGEGFLNYYQPEFHYVWAFVEDHGGVLWFAGYSKGLFKYDGDEIREVTDYLTLTNGKKNFYHGSNMDKRGTLWFPCEDGLLSHENGRFRLDKIPSFNSPIVYAFSDHERDVLLTGLCGKIGFRYPDGKMVLKGTDEGLHPNNCIFVIEEDKNHQYWLASDNGVSRYDPESDQFFNYTVENGRLPVRGILSLHRDFRGNMWLGSDDGLLRYDYERDSIWRVSGELLREPIKMITYLDTTHLLIGGLNGLYVLDLERYYDQGEVTVKYFNRYNGYMGIEPRTQDFYHDSKGYIWVGSATSTVRIDPKKLPLDTPPLDTYISKINDQFAGLGNDTLHFDCPYGEKNVKIAFEAVGFSRSLNTMYSYSIDGKSWSDWQKEPYVYLENLNSGMHYFSVRAQTVGVGDRSVKPATLVFSISLPFYSESYFPILAISIGSLLVALILFGLYYHYKMRKREMENIKQLNYLKVQTLQAQMNPHFIFNVLTTLQNLILNNSDPITTNNYLVKLSTLIRRFLDNSVRSEMPTTSLTQSEITLEEEIEMLQMYLGFEKLSYKDSFDYTIEVPDEKNVSGITLPPLLIQPFVENAVKHGIRYKEGKGFVKVSFSIEGEYLVCRVEDDGVGKERAREIQKKSLRIYKSHGTRLVKQRVKVLNQIGYKIEIESENRKGGGTMVTIKIAHTS
jgi:ligand-binding sensor domain-containing protein